MKLSSRLTRFLEAATIEELQREWEAKGYKSARQRRVGDFRADLVMSRGVEKVVFEVETAESLAEHREAVTRLAHLATSMPNTTFHLVIANPPQRKTIEIEDLESLLGEYLSETTLTDLDTLSTHTSVEAVDEIDLLGVEIKRGEIRAQGNGVVHVRLQFGSGGDLARGDGVVDHDSFPFEFDITLDAELTIEEVHRLSVDTSSYYE